MRHTARAVTHGIATLGLAALLASDASAASRGRFTVLTRPFHGAAVLDRETGLIWERAPDAAIVDWGQALARCYEAGVGGQLGWRLPAVDELARLVSPDEPSLPRLPPGHPFEGILSADGPIARHYWSSTADASNPVRAFFVSFATASVGRSAKSGVAVLATFHAWCVRDGSWARGAPGP